MENTINEAKQEILKAAALIEIKNGGSRESFNNAANEWADVSILDCLETALNLLDKATETR